MKKVLIFGGTRFFGKKLVALLLKNGVDVTIATRGRTEDDFGRNVNRIVIDRSEDNESWKKLEQTEWDVVYDNICYSSNDAALSAKYLAKNTKRYVLTSTLSVYNSQEKVIVEADYEPEKYELKMVHCQEVDYQEGKRQAEAFFFQKTDLSMAAVRFPIVLGIDDYTKRLHWHIEKVKKSQSIGMTNVNAKMCFITSDEAAKFLYWIGIESSEEGAFNACSNDEWPLKKLIEMIEEKTNRKAIIVNEANDENESPFGIDDNYYMSNQKAKKLGFSFTSLNEWMPKLIDDLSE